MTSVINTIGAKAGISLHDLAFDGAFNIHDQLMDLAGSGEVYNCRCSSAVTLDTALRVDGGPWRIHDNDFRVDDIAILLLAGVIGCIVCANILQGDNDESILIEGDDNIIAKNRLKVTGLRVTGDDNLIIGNIFGSANTTNNGFVVAGDRNFLDGNKIINTTGTAPAVGIEIQSGATDNIIGVNDLSQATIPITDAGTGTIYKAVREALWIVTGTLTTGAGVDPRRINEDIFIIDAAAVVNTAPTDASLIVDIHLNGTTIFTTQGNRPTILTTATDSGLAIPDVTAATGGDVLTVDIDQIGSTIAGADLAVVVRYINVGNTG